MSPVLVEALSPAMIGVQRNRLVILVILASRSTQAMGLLTILWEITGCCREIRRVHRVAHTSKTRATLRKFGASSLVLVITPTPALLLHLPQRFPTPREPVRLCLKRMASLSNRRILSTM